MVPAYLRGYVVHPMSGGDFMITSIRPSSRPVKRIQHIAPDKLKNPAVLCKCLKCGFSWYPIAVIGLIDCPACKDRAEGRKVDGDSDYEYGPMKDTRDGRDL
jgi:hypothetical protein